MWIAIDYAAVKEFSTPRTASFQVWIGIASNPLSEDITMTYGAITSGANGDGGLLTVGAENRAGLDAVDDPQVAEHSGGVQSTVAGFLALLPLMTWTESSRPLPTTRRSWRWDWRRLFSGRRYRD